MSNCLSVYQFLAMIGRNGAYYHLSAILGYLYFSDGGGKFLQNVGVLAMLHIVKTSGNFFFNLKR